MKVLYIITGLRYGGAEKLLYFACKHLKYRYHLDISVAYLDSEAPLAPLFVDLGIPLHFVGKSAFCSLKLLKLIMHHRYDVIHTHLIHADVFGRSAAFLCRIFYHPLIFSTTHDRYPFRWERSLRFILIRFIDRFFARLSDSWVLPVSRTIEATLVSHERIPEEKIRFLANAVEIQQTDQRSTLCQQNLFRCLFIGRLIPEKNLPCLLSAMEILSNLHIELTIVGTGPLRNEVDQIIKARNLSEMVSVIMPVPLPEQLYIVHDLLILPSLVEGMPLVILEAFSCNLPVLGSNIPGIKELLAEGRGTLFQSNNAEHLAANMQHAVKNYDEWLEKAKSAREYVIAHHSMKKYASQLFQFYSGKL